MTAEKRFIITERELKLAHAGLFGRHNYDDIRSHPYVDVLDELEKWLKENGFAYRENGTQEMEYSFYASELLKKIAELRKAGEQG